MRRRQETAIPIIAASLAAAPRRAVGSVDMTKTVQHVAILMTEEQVSEWSQ